MKKILLSILLVLIFCMGCNQNSTSEQVDETPSEINTQITVTIENTPTYTPVNTPTHTPEITNEVLSNQYYPIDISILDIYFHMPLDEVEEILGEPINITEQYAGAIDDMLSTYEYEFGEIIVMPYYYNSIEVSKVVGVEITKPGYDGPRDLQVADHVLDVIEKLGFRKEAILDKEGDSVIYENEYGNGSVRYDEQGNISAIFLMEDSIYLGYFYIAFEEDKVSSYGFYLHID